MPRPRSSSTQQARAYKLHSRGLGPTAIFETLCEDFDEDAVSARTISTWVKGFKGLSEEVTSLDVQPDFRGY